MNSNIWGLVKRLYRCFVLKEKAIVFVPQSTTDITPKPLTHNYVRVKKGNRRYVLKFTETTKQVPEWVRRKNLGRLTKKEMACMN